METGGLQSAPYPYMSIILLIHYAHLTNRSAHAARLVLRSGCGSLTRDLLPAVRAVVSPRTKPHVRGLNVYQWARAARGEPSPGVSLLLGKDWSHVRRWPATARLLAPSPALRWTNITRHSQQGRTAAIAAERSNNTGMNCSISALSSTNCTHSFGDDRTILPPLFVTALAPNTNMRIPREVRKVTCDRSTTMARLAPTVCPWRPSPRAH